MAMETTIAASEAARMAQKTPKAPRKAMKTINKATEMVDIGYGTIMAMDWATGGIHETLSEASDGHSGNVERVTILPIRKCKASRRHHPMMVERQ